MSREAMGVYLTLVMIVMAHAGMFAILHPKKLAKFMYVAAHEPSGDATEQSNDAESAAESSSGGPARLSAHWIPVWGGIALALVVIGSWDIFPKVAHGVDPVLVSWGSFLLLLAAFLLSFSVSPAGVLRRFLRNAWFSRHSRVFSIGAVILWLSALLGLISVLFGWPVGFRS